SVVQPIEDGGCFVAWRDRGRFLKELTEISKLDAEAYFDFFEYLNRFARTLGVSLFEPPPTLAELASRLRGWRDEEVFGKIILGSIRDLLDEWFESEAVRAPLAMLSIMSSLAGPSTPGTPLMLMLRPLSLASTNVTAQHDPRVQPMRGSTGLPRGGMGSI